MSEPTTVRFLVLLKLTTQGRQNTAAAAQNLTAAGERLLETGGVVQTLLFTYGQYDAVMSGESTSQQALTDVVAWIIEQGYFSTQTQLGVDPSTYMGMHH